jgi:hypothetical protein
MREDEWNDLQAKLMAQSVTTHRRNGHGGPVSLWTGYRQHGRRASDYGRRRLAWVVLAAWAVGVGSLLLVQAALR